MRNHKLDKFKQVLIILDYLQDIIYICSKNLCNQLYKILITHLYKHFTFITFKQFSAGESLLLYKHALYNIEISFPVLATTQNFESQRC